MSGEDDAVESDLAARMRERVADAEALPLEQRAAALAALTDELSARLDADDPLADVPQQHDPFGPAPGGPGTLR